MHGIYRYVIIVLACTWLIHPSTGAAEETSAPQENNTEQTTASQPNNGAATTNSGTPTTFNPVVISATRTESTVSDLPVSTTVLDQQAVKQTPAFTTDGVLQSVPSLNFSSYLPSYINHPTGNWLSIRGLGGGAPHVLVLMDGVPVNDPFMGYIDFNRIPKERIDRVEIVRGGSSSLWGSFAEGGVVNFITHPIDATELSVTTMGGSDNTFRSDIHSSQKVDDRLGISLDVNYFITAGYDPLVPDEQGSIDRATASNAAIVQMKMGYHTAEFTGFLRGNYYQFNQNYATNLETNDTRTVNMATGGRWRLTPQDDIHASIFYLNEQFNTTNTDLSPPAYDRNAEYISNIHQTPATDIGGSFQWTHTSPNLNWLPLMTTGVDLRHIEGVDRQQDIATPGASPTELNGGGQELFAGLYGEATIQPILDLDIQPSLRVDYFRNYDGSIENIPGSTTQFDNKDYLEWDPKLAVRYQLTKALAVRASVYRSFRAPTLDNLYREFTSPGFVLIPNPQVRPEVLWGEEAGVDIAREPFHGQVNFFYNTIRDQINFVTTSYSPIYTVQVANIGETRSLGVEAMGDLQLTDSLSTGVSYSYTNAEIISYSPDPSIEGNRVPNVPVHSFSAVARYNQAAGAKLEVRFRFLSTAWDDTGNTLKLDAHTVVDASASYPIWKYAEVFVIGQNLLNNKYVATTAGGTQLGPPFQIFGGLTVSFGGVRG